MAKTPNSKEPEQPEEQSLLEKLRAKLSSSSEDDAESIKAQIAEHVRNVEVALKNHHREVAYETKEPTIEVLVNHYHEGLEDGTNELFIPDYQREFIWTKTTQSRLIESILIGLPIPPIFTGVITDEDEELDEKSEIVDGSQRVRTIHAFYKNRLILQGLELVPQLNEFKFEDLSAPRKRKFKKTAIRLIELSKASEETRRDLFERINTNSDILEFMEVRKGSKWGQLPFYQKVMLPCVKDPLFKKLTPLSSTKIKREEHSELVLRFFAYLNRYKEFNHSVKEFLDDFFREGLAASEEERSKMISEFQSTMKFIDTYFPLGFRKSKGSKVVFRVRFEALAVGTALALREKPGLEPDDVSGWIFSEELKLLTTSDASNSATKVVKRIEFVRDRLLGK